MGDKVRITIWDGIDEKSRLSIEVSHDDTDSGHITLQTLDTLISNWRKMLLSIERSMTGRKRATIQWQVIGLEITPAEQEATNEHS